MALEAEATKLALARTMLARLDQEYLDALKQAVAEELRAEVYQKALDEARATLEEEFGRRRARLEDQSARYKEEVDNEIESRIEQGVEAARADLLQDLEDRLGDLRQARNQARAERDAAEGQLLALLRELLGAKGRYLRNSHIEAFDQFAINGILKRHGWRVRSKSTFSERTVATRIGEAHYQARALFWIEAAPAEGVADAADDEDPVHQDVTPGPLALPEGPGV